MIPHYHQTTVRLPRREPVVARPVVRRLAALEQTLRIELPVAVRDWYNLEDDVGETRDHAADETDRLEQMKAEMQRLHKEINEPAVKKP
jgi:hypothetical protein